MRRFEIPGRLAGMNEYTEAQRANAYKGGAMKKRDTERIAWIIRSQLRGYKAKPPVIVHFRWLEPNRRRDVDNICGYGHKVILDAIVRAGLLRNDSQAYVVGLTDSFGVDAKNPRIVVEIEETGNS